MSEVEETLEQVKLQSGVEGYVIVDKDGQVLRRLPSMPAAKAEVYAEFMTVLATKARGVVRDLDPKNELRYLRVRAEEGGDPGGRRRGLHRRRDPALDAGLVLSRRRF